MRDHEMTGAADTSVNELKYWAFISYSSKDNRWGEWLIVAIEKYRIPKSLVGLKTGRGTIPSRLYPIFRDRDELRAGADLGEGLDHALSQSRHLIVVCSPNSADPGSWVNNEITSFKAMGRERDVLALIVAGEPFASDREASDDEECLPAALRFTADANGELTTKRAEPLAADVTRDDENSRVSRRKALLKLIACMIDVDFDTLEQRDRRRRRQRIAVWSAAAVSLVVAFLGLAALWLDSNLVSTSQQLAKQAKEKILTEKDLGALLAL